MLDRTSKYYPKTFISKAVLILVFIKVVGIMLPIEFSNNGLRDNCRNYVSLSIVISCFFWFITHMLNSNSGWIAFLSYILLLPVFFISALASLIMLSGPCVVVDGKNVYTEKRGRAKIILRTGDCGATTGHYYQPYYVKPLTPLFNIVWKVDTSQINREEWEQE